MEVFDNRIIDNKETLIPLKRSIEGIGINYDDEKNQAGYMDTNSRRFRSEGVLS